MWIAERQRRLLIVPDSLQVLVQWTDVMSGDLLATLKQGLRGEKQKLLCMLASEANSASAEDVARKQVLGDEPEEV